MSVGALYIVKNEEEFLPFSLQAVHDAVDEVIVVDNGSTDRTPAIVRNFAKARLWYSDADDFSALWNMALLDCRCDWFMFLAADEVFYPDLREVLPRLVADPGIDAYICWYYHLMRSFWYMQNSSDRDALFYRTFLVRRRPGVRFEGRVHERLVGVGTNVADSGLHYVHYGYAKPQREVFERWRLYARMEGIEHVYEGRNPETILDDRPLHPFTRGHPPVIADHVERRAAALAAQGQELFRRPW